IMTHFGHEFVEKLLKGFAKAVSTSLLIILFFILQYIFDMDFKCLCKSSIQPNDVLYLLAPPVILTWVLLYIESCNQRRFCNIFKKKCFLNFLCCFCRIFLKFISVGVIWSTAVLLEGDWYFCFKTKSDSNHIGLPCKENARLTIAMILICISLLLWTIADVSLALCYRIRNWKSAEQRCCPPYYKVVYEHLLEEQVSSFLKEELTQLATERAKVICQKHIQIIKDYEKNIDDDTINVEDSWHKISASDFYMEREGQEERREERRE
ncbi:hypothetical protein NL108_002437, partial [Boleophthalmus pectinirostris]